MLLGLTKPDAGSMKLLGHELPAGRTLALARVGAIVEEPAFHRYLTGRENLTIIAAAREPAAHGRIDGALARVGLADRANDRVKTYSQGMRQRLGLARCLLADPELLILDEPTNGLDPAGIQEFREFVRSLVEEGRTVVLSSHLLDEVEKICDHVAILDCGSIVAQGPIAEPRGRRRGHDHRRLQRPGLRRPRPRSPRLGHLGRRGGPGRPAQGSCSLVADAEVDPGSAAELELRPRRGRPRRSPARARARLARSKSSSRSPRAWGCPRERGGGFNRPCASVQSGGRFRLARAEFLKLRKHRGLVLTTALLTIGIVVLVYAILVLLHVFNPDHHGPAGGVDNLRHAMELMSVLGAAVAAPLVGAFAATGDVDSGVFRELVVTGRSRTHLFLARVPGGLAVLWVFVAAAYSARGGARRHSRGHEPAAEPCGS